MDGSDVMWISGQADPAPVDCVNYLTVNTNQQQQAEGIDLSRCLVKLTGQTLQLYTLGPCVTPQL